MNATTTRRNGRTTPVATECRQVCSCGQELDVCRHRHCPRCGHRIPAGGSAADRRVTLRGAVVPLAA